jgi:hypothetical protein
MQILLASRFRKVPSTPGFGAGINPTNGSLWIVQVLSTNDGEIAGGILPTAVGRFFKSPLFIRAEPLLDERSR